MNICNNFVSFGKVFLIQFSTPNYDFQMKTTTTTKKNENHRQEWNRSWFCGSYRSTIQHLSLDCPSLMPWKYFLPGFTTKALFESNRDFFSCRYKHRVSFLSLCGASVCMETKKIKNQCRKVATQYILN